MKEFLLICGGIVPFLYLFFLMNRLDRYLYEYKREKSVGRKNKELRIAFENLDVGGAFTCFLKNFSEKYDDYMIKLYYNEKYKILSCLKRKKLDVVFFAGETARYGDGVFCKKVIQIQKQNVMLADLDTPFVPMNDEELQVNVFLRINEQDPKILLFMKEFLAFYQNSFIKREFLPVKTLEHKI